MDREEGITLVKVLQGDHWDGLFDGNVLAAPDILQNLLLAAGLLYRDVHIIHFTGDPDEDVIAPQYVQLSVLKFSDVIAPLDTLFQQKQLEMQAALTLPPGRASMDPSQFGFDYRQTPNPYGPGPSFQNIRDFSTTPAPGPWIPTVPPLRWNFGGLNMNPSGGTSSESYHTAGQLEVPHGVMTTQVHPLVMPPFPPYPLSVVVSQPHFQLPFVGVTQVPQLLPTINESMVEQNANGAVDMATGITPPLLVPAQVYFHMSHLFRIVILHLS